MTSDIRADLNLLLRGVATRHFESERNGWRALLKAQSAAIPVVIEKLNAKIWSEKPATPLQRYLVVLLSLLHELDSPTALIEIKRLKATKLHPFHLRTIDLLETRFQGKPAESYLRGIPSTISAEMTNPGQIFVKLNSWIQIPPADDLKNVSRIDVVQFEPEFDFLGTHHTSSSAILLTWPKRHPNALKRWLNDLSTQHTFYHEIGHGALGHLEGGQVPEQEDEANAYARKLLRRAHPILALFFFIFLWPIRSAIRVFRT